MEKEFCGRNVKKDFFAQVWVSRRRDETLQIITDIIGKDVAKLLELYDQIEPAITAKSYTERLDALIVACDTLCDVDPSIQHASSKLRMLRSIYQDIKA